MRNRVTLLLLALGLCLLAMPAIVAAKGNIDEEVRSIGGKLQCPVCQGTSVADSPSPVAADMRDLIRTKLAAGESEKAILNYFVDRYGPAILREPPRSGFYSAVWWVPAAAILAGLLVVYGLVRRRRGTEASAPAPVPQASQEDLERYRDRLHDLERGSRP